MASGIQVQAALVADCLGFSSEARVFMGGPSPVVVGKEEEEETRDGCGAAEQDAVIFEPGVG